MLIEELFEKPLARGTDFVVGLDGDANEGKKIKIRMPKVGEIIDFGERNYYHIVYAFAATSSDYKAQLDDEGVDWQKVSDYEMFIRLFVWMRKKDLSILFGDLNLNKFELAVDNRTNEYVFVNEEDGLEINRNVYEVISAYICAMHGLEKTHETASDEPTRLAMIDEARERLNSVMNKPAKMQLRSMVCAMANMPEFKADYFKAMDYPISIFMDCVRQVRKIKHFNYTMQGIYAGTVDAKKVSKESFDWLNQAGSK